MITLTPTQIRGLKLAKDGKLFPLPPKKWTHLNAVVTYAKTDRFKERPQKVKFSPIPPWKNCAKWASSSAATRKNRPNWTAMKSPWLVRSG